jgi:integrase
MPYQQKKSPRSKSKKTHAKSYWYIRVPTPHGTRAMSTGTGDKRLAKRMEAMVDDLYRGRGRDPELLEWLHDRSLPREDRLDLLVLLDHYESNSIEALKLKRHARQNAERAAADAAAADVNQYVDAWYKDVLRRATPDHAERFLRAVRSFMPAGEVFTADRFQYQPLLDWANALTEPEEQDGLGLGAATAGRYRAGLYNFIEHLVNIGVVQANSLDRISPPKKAKPRDRHLLTPDAVRLVEAFGDPTNEQLTHVINYYGMSVLQLQGFLALGQGAGVEVSVSLDLKVGDVRPSTKEVRAPGTKTHTRDRVVRVAEWAWPWVAACAEGRPLHEKLFSTIPDRWVALDAFNAAIAPLVQREPKVFGDYWMRDGRHTYAVRAIKAGTPPKVVADQLGHVDPTLVLKVYGVYMPNSEERDRWERVAAAMDGDLAHAAPAEPEAPRVVAQRRTKIAWPSDDELLRRLTTQSVKALAEELGVSDVAIRKRLARSGQHVPDGRWSGVSRPRKPCPLRTRTDRRSHALPQAEGPVPFPDAGTRAVRPRAGRPAVPAGGWPVQPGPATGHGDGRSRG